MQVPISSSAFMFCYSFPFTISFVLFSKEILGNKWFQVILQSKFLNLQSKFFYYCNVSCYCLLSEYMFIWALLLRQEAPNCVEVALCKWELQDSHVIKSSIVVKSAHE